MSNFFKIFSVILGEAEQIVPIFVHNPKSQQVEAIVVTTANAALQAFGAPASQPPAPPAA